MDATVLIDAGCADSGAKIFFHHIANPLFSRRITDVYGVVTELVEIPGGRFHGHAAAPDAVHEDNIVPVAFPHRDVASARRARFPRRQGRGDG